MDTSGGKVTGTRKRKAHDSNMVLTPCGVCGGKSSGFHFGAITCEACKSFFRRTLKNKTKYTCLGKEFGQPCVLRLVKGGYVPCPACRWDRCLELNMSLDAIKKGRYSHVRKVEALQMSKDYRKSHKSEQVQEISSVSETGNPGTSIAPDQERIKLHPKSPSTSNESPAGDGVSSTEFHPAFDRDHESSSDSRDIPVHGTSDSPDSEIEKELMTEAGRDPTLGAMLYTELSDEENLLNKIIEAVTNAYDKQNFLPKGMLTRIFDVQYQHVKEREDNDELFGKLPVLPMDEYKKLFEDTGIDIDGRLEGFEQLMIGLEAIARKYISFVKAIPGFKLLSMRDQVSIVKGTKGVLFNTIFFPCYNVKGEVTTQPIGQGEVKNGPAVFLYDDKHRDLIFGKELMDVKQQMIRTLQNLELTDHENALMASVCVMHPDVCVTDDGKKKSVIIHDKLHKALKKVLLRRFNEKDTTRILTVIGNEIRETLHKIFMIQLKKHWQSFYEDFGSEMRIPTIVKEWFDFI